MENKEEILSSLKEKLENVDNLNSLGDIKVEYLGKKGCITALSSKIATLPIEEKKTFGAELNKLKTEATEILVSESANSLRAFKGPGRLE